MDISYRSKIAALCLGLLTACYGGDASASGSPGSSTGAGGSSRAIGDITVKVNGVDSTWQVMPGQGDWATFRPGSTNFNMFARPVGEAPMGATHFSVGGICPSDGPGQVSIGASLELGFYLSADLRSGNGGEMSNGVLITTTTYELKGEELHLVGTFEGAPIYEDKSKKGAAGEKVEIKLEDGHFDVRLRPR